MERPGTRRYTGSRPQHSHKGCVYFSKKALTHWGMKTELPKSIADTFTVCRQGYGSSRAAIRRPDAWQTSGPLSTTRKVVSVEVVLQTHWKYGRRYMKVQEKDLEVGKPRSAQERPGLRAYASERVRLTGRQEYKE